MQALSPDADVAVRWRGRYSLQHYVGALAETVAATNSQSSLASGQALNETIAPGKPTQAADSCGGGGGGILGTIHCFFGSAHPRAPCCCHHV